MKWTVFVRLLLILACGVFGRAAEAASGDALRTLAQDFWKWRAHSAPFTGDDVNRMERPGGTRDWSRSAIEKRRSALSAFETRWKAIDATHWPVAQQVDFRLIGSALARVHWELEVNPRWQ